MALIVRVYLHPVPPVTTASNVRTNYIQGLLRSELVVTGIDWVHGLQSVSIASWLPEVEGRLRNKYRLRSRLFCTIPAVPSF
jgi:hypothetical protein